MYKITQEEKQSFDNGCTVWYEAGFDSFIGTSPYGRDELYTKDINSVTAWLKYWEDDRDENGFLLDVPKEDTYFQKNKFPMKNFEEIPF